MPYMIERRSPPESGRGSYDIAWLTKKNGWSTLIADAHRFESLEQAERFAAALAERESRRASVYVSDGSYLIASFDGKLIDEPVN